MTIIERKKKMTEKLDPITPGEILLEEFMHPLSISQNKLAREIDVPITRIHDIIHGKRSITADTALRLAAYFGTTPQVWMGLQTEYDLRKAQQNFTISIAPRIRKCTLTAPIQRI